MKKLYILLLACAALMACEKNNANKKIVPPTPDPTAFVIVVQMPDAQQIENVIIGHPYAYMDCATYTPVFDEETLQKCSKGENYEKQ